MLNAAFGYDIRARWSARTAWSSCRERRVVVKSAGRYAGRVPADWRERFVRAFDVEFQEWLDDVAAGASPPARAAGTATRPRWCATPGWPRCTAEGASRCCFASNPRCTGAARCPSEVRAYTAVLHDRPIAEALGLLRGLGLDSAEVNSGGFLPAPHLPIATLRTSADARSEYLGLFAEHGITLTALNCNGNPLHADPECATSTPPTCATPSSWPRYSGAPGGHHVRAARHRSRRRAARLDRAAWDSAYLDARDYQWNSVALPYWRDIQARAAAATCTCASRCTRTTSSTTRPPCCGWPSRSTPPTWPPRWTPATCSGRASTRWRPSGRWATWSARRRQGHPHQPRRAGQRGAGRPALAHCRRLPGRGIPRRAVHAVGLAGELLVGLRRGRPRPRHSVLDPVPRRAARGGPRTWR